MTVFLVEDTEYPISCKGMKDDDWIVFNLEQEEMIGKALEPQSDSEDAISSSEARSEEPGP